MSVALVLRISRQRERKRRKPGVGAWRRTIAASTVDALSQIRGDDRFTALPGGFAGAA
ncbi:hypothetical protein OK348_07925 [Flavobacterium sp. MXW15]|uniref:Uncharacterized protein n=1 Tax=Xanthomonas chitinilytica TaxID=2989819 RepID=A0ABT3JU11_9XANT|nr:hypothetical protein [Xanthomonas sp. H13-6]MCW4454722.1 hypothetical protein [Flavobacterium sp. MXW15]MCW4471961.1 hypothetical protein [Xanthomonas sp. H13-6]